MFHLEYPNGLRAAEPYGEDLDVDSQFLEEYPKFEAVARERAGIRRQYLANILSPKRDVGDPIALIYFAIQVTDNKKMEKLKEWRRSAQRHEKSPPN